MTARASAGAGIEIDEGQAAFGSRPDEIQGAPGGGGAGPAGEADVPAFGALGEQPAGAADGDQDAAVHINRRARLDVEGDAGADGEISGDLIRAAGGCPTGVGGEHTRDRSNRAVVIPNVEGAPLQFGTRGVQG